MDLRTWLLVVLLIAVVAWYLSFSAGRLDRLHHRVEGARSALDAQLVRRAEAAVELGAFAAEGLDVSLEMIFPVDRAYAALKDGSVDFVAGSAHSALSAFPDWKGVKLICAQAQGMYWFLVMRREVAAARGEISCVKGRTIGAAPWVEMGLRRLLVASGIEPDRDGVRIVPLKGKDINFGVTAANALADGVVDGFWANGMGAEIAVRNNVGTVVLDVRRGDGPKGCFDYTFASVATTDALIATGPAEGLWMLLMTGLLWSL